MRVRKDKRSISSRDYRASSRIIGAAKIATLKSRIESENYSKIKEKPTKGPRAIFQEAYMIDWKIEDGIKALMKNSIDPRMFKDQMIEWAEEAKRAKTKLMKKIEVDEGR